VKPNSEYKMAGVKWYGEGVFHRETVRGDAISARYLSPLVPGALIYNRLFAWKASFAVVPTELSDCFVSNEFPQFIVDASTALPEYLYLWCVSEQTIKAVNAASTGSAAVSRNRFREEFLLDFRIPLPPLSIQRKIVAYWEEARTRVDTALNELSRLVLTLDAELRKAARMDVLRRPCLIAYWKDLDALDMKSAPATIFRLDNPTRSSVGSLALRWDGIDWARGRMGFRSPKTEHYRDGAYREVPIFSKLLPYLREAWEAAPEGSEYVISR